jgi:O-antigen ligase
MDKTAILTRRAGSDIIAPFDAAGPAASLLKVPSPMLDRRLPERAAGQTLAAPFPGLKAAWRRGEIALQWAAVVLGASIPVSVVVDNVILYVLLFFWLAGGAYREKLASIRDNPVAWLALVLWGLFAVGALYSIGSRQDILEALGKSMRILLIPALVYLMREPEWRERGRAAFVGSMLVALVLSWLLWAGFVSGNNWIKGNPLDPAVFKAHNTQNVFMAFAMFVMAQAALETKDRRARAALWTGCAIAAANVLFIVPGRTGMVVLLVLFVYFLARMLKVKGLVIAGVALAALAAAILASPESMLHRRITLADEEFTQWRAGKPPEPTSSVGLRLEYLENTLDIIARNPAIGVGTGGFGKAYAERVQGTRADTTQNPHNEILLLLVQFGVAGFALFTGLLVTQWRVAKRLPNAFDMGAARAFVLAMGVTSVLASTLLDHAEGFFFAYMSGLLFSGYRAHAPDIGRQRVR